MSCNQYEYSFARQSSRAKCPPQILVKIPAKDPPKNSPLQPPENPSRQAASVSPPLVLSFVLVQHIPFTGRCPVRLAWRGSWSLLGRGWMCVPMGTFYPTCSTTGPP